jgi:hypothetical protein
MPSRRPSSPASCDATGGGTAFNATVLSYRGSMDMGLNIDTAAVDEPALLRDCIRESFDALLAVKP